VRYHWAFLFQGSRRGGTLPGRQTDDFLTSTVRRASSLFLPFSKKIKKTRENQLLLIFFSSSSLLYDPKVRIRVRNLIRPGTPLGKFRIWLKFAYDNGLFNITTVNSFFRPKNAASFSTQWEPDKVKIFFTCYIEQTIAIRSEEDCLMFSCTDCQAVYIFWEELVDARTRRGTISSKIFKTVDMNLALSQFSNRQSYSKEALSILIIHYTTYRYCISMDKTNFCTCGRFSWYLYFWRETRTCTSYTLRHGTNCLYIGHKSGDPEP
jgi:hypothetical protein